MKEKTTGIVRFKLDSKNPPKLAPEQLKRLREMKDEDIDYSDIPRRSVARCGRGPVR